MSSWSFRGTNLSDLGVVTLVWDSAKKPLPRGENIIIPFRHGRVHIAKYYEQRTITLGIALLEDTLADLEEAVDTLKALTGQRTLGVLQQTMENGSVRNGLAECVGDLAPDRDSPLASNFTLDFIMPDPFFRNSAETNVTIIIDASPKTTNIVNVGTAEERNAEITLTGPLTNPVITNTTNGVVLTYMGVIAGGEVVVISTNEMGEYTAVKDGTTNVIGNVTHSGSSALMIMDVGDNNLSITSDVATTGAVAFAFSSPYL